MTLERAPHNLGELLEFYEDGLSALGGLCERTWHDRLEVVAAGRAARLWNSDGALHEIELQFASAEAAAAIIRSFVASSNDFARLLINSISRVLIAVLRSSNTGAFSSSPAIRRSSIAVLVASFRVSRAGSLFNSNEAATEDLACFTSWASS